MLPAVGKYRYCDVAEIYSFKGFQSKDFFTDDLFKNLFPLSSRLLHFRDLEFFWKVAEILAGLTIFPALITPAKNWFSHGAVLWIKT